MCAYAVYEQRILWQLAMMSSRTCKAVLSTARDTVSCKTQAANESTADINGNATIGCSWHIAAVRIILVIGSTTDLLRTPAGQMVSK
jgi:hypothetical protein